MTLLAAKCDTAVSHACHTLTYIYTKTFMRRGAQGGDAVCKSLVSSNLRAALLKTVFYAAICRLLACVLRLSAMRFAVSCKTSAGRRRDSQATTAERQVPSGGVSTPLSRPRRSLAPQPSTCVPPVCRAIWPGIRGNNSPWRAAL